MSTIPYDPQRCSLFRPANLDELSANEQLSKSFFSSTITQAIINSAEAGLCAELSRLAYFKFENSNEKKEELDRLLGKIDLNLVTSFSEEEGTQGYVAENENSIFLVFRGTESVDFHKGFKGYCQRLHPLEFFKSYKFLKYRRKSSVCNFREAFHDFITDILFLKRKSNDKLQGRIHAGFLEAFESSKAQWESDVRAKVEGNGKPVIICGHSLGAALATLAAAYLLTDFPGRVRLHTFGSPRVGNKEFADSLTGIIHERHVDCRDIVTRVPPELFCYVHHGEPSYIFSDGRIATNPAPSEMKADMRKAFWSYLYTYKKWPFQNDNVWFRGLADHAPINYVSGVLKLR